MDLSTVSLSLVTERHPERLGMFVIFPNYGKDGSRILNQYYVFPVNWDGEFPVPLGDPEQKIYAKIFDANELVKMFYVSRIDLASIPKRHCLYVLPK